MGVGKKRKNKKNKLLLKFFLVFVIVYLAFRAFPATFSSAKTLIPKKDKLLDTVSARGVLIKDETLYLANNNGMVETFIKEGQRVKAGTRVATLTSSEDSSAIEGELYQVEQFLEELKGANIDIDKSSKLTPEEYRKNTISEIQKAIKNDEYDKVYILKEQLNSISNSNTKTENTNEDDTISSLETRKADLTEAMNKSLKHYDMEHGGLVSYKVDGLETKYTPSDFEKYTYERLDKEVFNSPGIDNKIKEKKYEVKINEPIYKAIDNFSWYMCILIDDLKSIEDIKESRTLTIRINDDKNNMTGRVIGINTFKNTGVIILKFTSRLHDFYDLRSANIEILKSNRDGYKIPREAIISKKNEKGVLIKDLSGVVRFRPVIIIGEDEKNYYLKSGDVNGYIRKDDNNTIRTITEFDEIFLKPSSVREGSILK